MNVEMYEMNEMHKHDDNSSDVPQGDLYLTAHRIRLITTCSASGSSPTPKAIVKSK